MLASSLCKIRLIATYDEYIDVASLQKEVWGAQSIEIVPPSILMVNQKIGGVVAGAFAPDGELVAFVYGLSGERGGEPVHWSHMLAVKTSWRGKGLGLALKEFQRRFVKNKGIRIIHWTCDPLESVNAGLNLRRLGALPMEYACDLYGKGEEGELHRGIGTDRFILTWFMEPEDRTAHLSRYHVPVNPLAAQTVVSETGGFLPAPPGTLAILIEIPENIQHLKAASAERAMAWRRATQSAFLHYFTHQFAVVDFVIDQENNRFYYVMAGPK